MIRHSPLRRPVCLVAAAVLAVSALTVDDAAAAARLDITPITWNVIGLDANDVTEGPDSFPVGARVCNGGDQTATNVSADFTFTEAPTPTYLSTVGPTSLAFGDLAPGGCVDAYFTVEVARNAAAFDTTRGYRISATADGLGAVTTPADRELYVERLIEQARNSISSITGPTTVEVGSTYQFVLRGSTAPQGYEQLESFVDFPNLVFRVVGVATTYSAGGASDRLYADACGWDNDPASDDYRSCLGRGKAGGEITTTYTVEIISAGAATVSAVIYDFSGSSFHYNADYGRTVLAITAIEPPTTTTTTAPPTTTTTTAPPTTTTTTAPPTTTTTTTAPPTTTTTTAPPTTTTTTTAPPPTTTVGLMGATFTPSSTIPPTTTTVAATAAAAAGPTAQERGSLPATGADPGQLLGLGGALVLTGLGLTGTARRRSGHATPEHD